MAKKPSAARLNLLSVVSFVTLLLILVSVFVLSGSFSDIVTTIAKSKASRANPKITESFADAFKDGVINEDKWIISKTEGANITETTADNLRFAVGDGNTGGKVKAGTLILKELLKNNGDFRATAVVYKPVVTGEGTGITALRFSSKGTDDDEAAVVRWQVSGTSSKVVFVVNGADGNRMETQAVDIQSNIAILRLDRINKKYRAFYKVGRDTSADTNWIPLGAEADASLGNEGHISITTHNAGVSNKYPKVIGRVDQFNFAWEGDPATKTGFSDAFANGALGKNWKIVSSQGAQVYENENDNLIMSLTSGGLNGKPRSARIVRTVPVIPEHKDFVVNTTLYKPTVVGAGQGLSGLGFVSTGNVDDEAAMVRWVVSGNTMSKLVFVARAPDGTTAEISSVPLDVSVKRITLHLARTGDKYAAFYRTGDSDTNFIPIGHEVSSNFGAAGHVMLMVNNIGANGAYPRVVGRFDGVTGSVSK